MPSEGKKCPKCGAEYSNEYEIPERGYKLPIRVRRVCKCGHEEKVR